MTPFVKVVDRLLIADPEPSELEPTRVRHDPKSAALFGAVFVLLFAAFAYHLSRFGSWLVDDAGISMAYAVNLAHGHGLVAEAGRAPVEGFSNPSWVALLAVLTKIGLFGRVSLLGLPDYVVVVKGLALALHSVVLVALAVVIRRVLTVVRGTAPPFGLFLGCWAATGLLLAANPSYVIWMGSGLENPLLAAAVALMAAVSTTAVPRPSPRAMVALGSLAGLAALTRPDGAIYAVVLVAVPLLAQGVARRQRAHLATWGFGSFACIFGAYVVFRLAYFGMLVPNTAIAKHQELPPLTNVDRLGDVMHALGVAVFVAYCGCVAAFVVARRNRNDAAMRVFAAGLVPLVTAIAAYVVLAADWMAEMRFLTPAWPLLAVATVLGGAQLVALAHSRESRVVFAVLIVGAAAIALPGWARRTNDFRAEPTAPLCRVGIRYGQHLAFVARTLGRDEESLKVASPDIGGMLLATDVHIVDLAGLIDRRIAPLIGAERSRAIARHVLADVRPDVILVHGPWVSSTGLTDARLAAEYVEVDRGSEWVRRDLLERSSDPDAVRSRIAENAARLDRPSPAACADVLFG